MNFVIGVDLGQVNDHSALSIVERLVEQSASELSGLTVLDHHHVRYLKRWPLNTEYRQVVKDTGELMHRTLKGGGNLLDSVIVIDATGVGKQVAELFLQAHRMGELGNYWPRPFVITGGREITHEVVPKRELIGKMQTLLDPQRMRLKIDEALPEAELLKRELQNFKVKTSPTGQDTFEAARDSIHDDLTLACALACWFRHNLTEPRWLEGEVATEPVRYH